MPQLVFEIAVATLASLVSLISGWWLRDRLLQTRFHALRKAGEDEKRRATEALDQLHDLTDRVALDVGTHSSRVRAISDELSSVDGSASVVGAVAKIIEANQRMQEQLESAEQQLRDQARRMQSVEAEARTDPLTGLANRRAYDDFVARQQAEFVRDGRPVSLMIVDVDRFKDFNDTHGHLAGDKVLQGVARVLRQAMREIDLVARYGGEEFAVVFPGSQAAQAASAVERARAQIEAATFQFEGTDLKVTASFGLAELRSDEGMEAMAKRADEALYASKAAGRNCCHWHDGEEPRPLQSLLESSPAGTATELASPTPETTLPPPRDLSDRQEFLSDVGRRVAESKRTGAPLSVILVKIDDLAELEARHGRAAGELVIKAATQFLQAGMRDMDHVARFDEATFALLLPGAKLSSAEMIAERLRNAVARCSLSANGAALRFTVSLGVADVHGGDDSDRLVQRTHKALEASGDCGNRTLVHDGKKVRPARITSAAGS